MQYPLNKRLPVGLTNEIYQTVDNQVIRLSRTTKEPFLDRANEIHVIKTVMQSKFNNTLVIRDWGYQNDKFFIITEYDSELVTLSTTGISRTNVVRVADLIKKLHKIKMSEQLPIKRFNPLAFYKTISSQVKTKKFHFSKADDILHAIKNLKNRPYVLCHNDLSINNVVFSNNQMLIIDFEYACLNDPLYDVAAFISETLLTEDNIKTWLKEWNLTEAEILITHQWMRYQNLLNTHWALLMAQNTGEEVFNDIAQIQFKRYQQPYPLHKWWNDIQPLI